MTAHAVTHQIIATSSQSERKLFPIPGGVHPPENKSQSLNLPLSALPAPAKIILPLNQHIGAPAKPLVAIGERVLKGQLVASAKGFISANIHSSISGTVTAIEELPVPHPSGLPAMSIVIRSDNLDESVTYEPCENYFELPKEQVIAKIQSAGIVGMGGAGFPTSVKLGGRGKIEHLIINGTECEPYITADDILMQTYPQEIIEGVKLLAHLLGNPADVVIGMEDNKPKAFTALKEAAKGTNVQVVAFPGKYPSGGEKQLIQRLTGKEVPSGKLPSDVGAVVQNVGTVYAAYRAVKYGEPLIERITTVVGGALQKQGNVIVRIGTPVADALSEFGFKERQASQLIMGGPMMGFTLETAEIPIVKTSNCIIAPSYAEMPPVAPAQPCIRCGLCAEACPAGLLPQQLYWYARSEDHEKLQAHNLFDCIECGACSFVCPSHIPLVQYYRASKGAIRTEREEKAKSDRSRRRFEFKQERIAKAEAEKEAKRIARQKAAQEAQQKMAEQKAKAPPAAAAPATAESAEDTRARLERALASAQTRLESAQAKHAEAVAEGSDRVDQMAARVKQAELKVQEAQAKLSETQHTPTASTVDTNSDDPVARAIAKAQAKNAMSPLEKAQSNVESLENRLSKAQEKHQQALSEGADNASALLIGVNKLTEKLEQARTELQGLQAESLSSTEKPAAAPDDPAAAAIERAKAKAEAMASMSPKEKLENQIESLTGRIAKAEQKLAAAQAENADTVEALALGVEKLKAKLASTQQELEQLNP